MKGDVEHALTGAAIGIEERPIPRVGKPTFLRNRRGPPNQLADDLFVFDADIIQRGDVALRHDQQCAGTPP